ncbi:MAG: hypothetical protein ACJAUK_001038 [Colwellia polaris]|jgi:hypothetical protein
MPTDEYNAIQQYMSQVAQDFDKYNDYCVIVAYLCNIQEEGSWTFKFLKKTYFEYLRTKLIIEPSFQGQNLWHFSEGYCSCLLESLLTQDDVNILSSEAFKYLIENDRNIYSIYESSMMGELINLESNYIHEFCEQIFEATNTKIFDEVIAYQFILEELEAASFGNDDAIAFVERNQFYIAEFEGAMADSRHEVDGADGPQQSLTRLIMGLPINIETKARIRIIVVQKIIDFWSSNTGAEIKTDIKSFL